MSLLECFWVFNHWVTPSLTVMLKFNVVALGASVSGIMSTLSGSSEETRSWLINETVLLIVFHSCSSGSAAQLWHYLVWLTVTIDNLDVCAEIPMLLLEDLGAMISFRMVCPGHLLFESSSILNCQIALTFVFNMLDTWFSFLHIWGPVDASLLARRGRAARYLTFRDGWQA